MELSIQMKSENNIKMIDLYLLEAYCDRYTGYDTFRNEFLEGMRQYGNICLHVVIEEYPTKHIYSEYKGKVMYIYFPKTSENKFAVLESFFNSAIKETSSMVFISNFFPAIFNVKAIKSSFPNAAVIHIIHDFPWLSLFNGNEVNYINYILGNGEKNLSLQDDKMVRYCTYDIIESFELFDKIVCLCKSTHQLLIDFYDINAEKIHLIPNGMADYAIHCQNDKGLYIKKKYNIPNDRMIILLSGRLTCAKGSDRICELLNQIDKSIRYCMVYVGQDDINRWVPSNMQIPIVQLGFKNFQEMQEIYSITDLGLFPSRFEQCSYAGIEYLMNGIPVLYVPSYGVRDMFNSENAFPVIEHNQITFREINEKRSAVRNSYFKSYTRKNMISQYVSLIGNLFAN